MKHTKLQKILVSRSMRQTELLTIIKMQNPKSKIHPGGLNLIVTGKKKNYEIKNIVIIANALNIKSLDEVVDMKTIKID